jgi:hypothetical protein
VAKSMKTGRPIRSLAGLVGVTASASSRVHSDPALPARATLATNLVERSAQVGERRLDPEATGEGDHAEVK